MNKTISLSIILGMLLILSAVPALAEHNQWRENYDKIEPKEIDPTEDGLQVRTQAEIREMNELSDDAVPEMNRVELHEKVQSNFTGLQNAIVHVENENAQERLQMNLERFQERYQFRYDRYDVVELNNQTFVRAQRQASFLGIFNFDIEDQYVVDEDGQVVNEKRGFLSKLFTRERYNAE